MWWCLWYTTSLKLKVPSLFLSSSHVTQISSRRHRTKRRYTKSRETSSRSGLSSLPSFYYMMLIHAQEAMYNFIHEMLHDSAAAQRIDTLWRVSSSCHFSEICNSSLWTFIESRNTKRVKRLKPSLSKACCSAFSSRTPTLTLGYGYRPWSIWNGIPGPRIRTKPQQAPPTVLWQQLTEYPASRDQILGWRFARWTRRVAPKKPSTSYTLYILIK